jgi:hypothetical protein
MTAQHIFDSLGDARSIINRARGKTYLGASPLADSKLIRVGHYLEKQLEDAEREIWRDAGLLEVEI